jgi:peptidoglycan hydrolase-like protein with peptidoglycan-binding domain
VRSTAQLRREWGPPCEFTRQTLTLYSGATLSGLNAKVVEAFRALDGVMRSFNYVPRSNSPGAWETGAYNCRKITNGTGYSLHAYGIAADINARTNPYGKSLITDMPTSMITAVKAIRTVAGLSVFRWGGDYPSFKDAMHYEIIASPDELARGIDWSTVAAEPPDPNHPRSWPAVRKGDKGPAVTRLNELLREAGFAETDKTSFGAKTTAAVRAYQQSRKLQVDGVAGLQTWTSLLNGLPAVAESDPSPFKIEASTPQRRSTIKPGSKGSEVEELQRRLEDEGFEPGSIDGVFGRKTKAAVIAFQKSCGLEPDGVCGPLTWRALL